MKASDILFLICFPFKSLARILAELYFKKKIKETETAAAALQRRIDRIVEAQRQIGNEVCGDCEGMGCTRCDDGFVPISRRIRA